MKVVERARAVWDKAITALMVLAAVLIMADMLAVSVTVILRQSLGVVWPGYFELTEYSLLWIAFLAAAWLLKNDLHIRIDMVVSHLNPRRRAITNIVAYIICIILLGVITWYGVKLTWHDYQAATIVSTVLRPLKWPIELIIPIGSFLLFIQSLMKVYEHLTSLKVMSKGQRTGSKL